MNTPIPHAGGCVCGAIRINVTGNPLRVTVCHCQWSQWRIASAFGIDLVFDLRQIEKSWAVPARNRDV
jgi:hypothetical protein